MVNRGLRFCLLLITLQAMTLQAVQYDENVLQIFSKIAPRLVLLSSKKSEVTEQIDLCVVHEKADAYVAERFGRMIKDNASGGTIDTLIRSVEIEEVHLCAPSQLLFFFNTSAANIQNALDQLSKSAPITVAYDSKLLGFGIDVSLFFGRSVTPYIDIARLKKKQITFDEVMLRVSKIYVEPKL
ncbi:MAG: hypothetical protein JXK05_05980 [Campylobacterales bacterium]|nr:hypothetical protein [Campylobacterales bacterium]